MRAAAVASALLLGCLVLAADEGRAQAANQQTSATTSAETSTSTPSQLPGKPSTAPAPSSPHRKRPHAAPNSGACEYEKGAWDGCDSNGLQRRTLKLRQVRGAAAAAAAKCEPIKIIQRECKAAGCKYLRGEWSAACVDGKRTRVDKLVSRLSPAKQAPVCQPQRRVTKDCKRTCHYIKSAWSECSNGFRTRNLTLAESGGWCAKVKQLKRECRLPATTTTTANPLPPTAAASAPGGAANKLTAAQRRRLKHAQKQEQRREQQQQRLQQQQPLAPTNENNNNNNNNNKNAQMALQLHRQQTTGTSAGGESKTLGA